MGHGAALACGGAATRTTHLDRHVVLVQPHVDGHVGVPCPGQCRRVIRSKKGPKVADTVAQTGRARGPLQDDAVDVGGPQHLDQRAVERGVAHLHPFVHPQRRPFQPFEQVVRHFRHAVDRMPGLGRVRQARPLVVPDETLLLHLHHRRRGRHLRRVHVQHRRAEVWRHDHRGAWGVQVHAEQQQPQHERSVREPSSCHEDTHTMLNERCEGGRQKP